MLGELLSKKLLRDKRGDVSLSGSQHFAAGAPRGEHGNTTLPSASSRRVSLPFTQFPAHLGGPFDTHSTLRRTLVKESRLQLGGSSQDFFSRSLPPPLEAPSTRCPALVDAQPPPSPMCSLALVDALPHPRLVLVHFTRAKSAVVVLSLNASPF